MIRAIVTDIEGTTSSLSFVKDVLFPYARKHIAGFIAEQQNEAAVGEQLTAIKKLVGKELTLEEIAVQLHQWIDQDQKITPLKTLQGLLWEKGYRQGDFKGHVYQDAADCLRQWHAAGIALYVYSSGSVYAQKLLFEFSEFGDMTSLFSGYFDTNTGLKQDTHSYEKIAEEISVAAGEILFLSDIKAELDAAKLAGMQTCWLLRDEIGPASEHTQVMRFNEIDMKE